MKTNFTENVMQYLWHLNKFSNFKMPKDVNPETVFAFPSDFNRVLKLSVYKS